MNVAPVHMTKHAAEKLHADHDLDSHLAVFLDWFFLARSRWLAPVVRTDIRGSRCGPGAARGGAHGVWIPGKSFFGWALAASGLAPPPASFPGGGCDCGVSSRLISVAL